VSTSALHKVSYKALALRSLDQLPPFSPILNRLMASLADEEVSFAEIAALIERDTVLSANVLKLVNSALYGRRGTVSSVKAAVSILGLNKLRNAVLGLSVSRIWNRMKTPPSWDMGRFNRHSAAVAVLSDIVVQRVEVEYPEGAFAAGLLHDLGRLMIATSLPDEFEQIQRQSKATGRSIQALEAEMLEVSHSELSAAALSKWNLPAPIQRAALYHHHPELDPDRTRTRTLSAVVHVANAIANVLGHGCDAAQPAEGSSQIQAVLDAIGWAAEETQLRETFRTEFAAYDQSLNG
jgi:HD-like signal output (HDOD) protein